MNYLQLVQAMHRILRADNNKLGSAPASVVSQEGLLDELVFFIAQAWLDIQNESPAWRFMWREGTLTLAAGTDTANPTAIPDFDSIVLSESDGRGRFITMYRDSIADEITVRFVPHPSWSQSYLERGERGPGQPANFTVLPDNRLRFDLKADLPYTLRFNYRRTNQSLIDNNDEPIAPGRHHMAIVWWAICHYYCTTRDGADRLRQTSMLQLRREMQKLHNAQGPDAIVPEGTP